MSSGILSARKKRTPTAEVKIAVMGSTNVGKSALTVRFVTKRYIGEYNHSAESATCRLETTLDADLLTVEICEYSANLVADMSSASCADAILLVYSITDRDTFCFIRQQLRQQLQQLQQQQQLLARPEPAAGSWPMLLVANKSDLGHLRQVGTEEGEILARDMDCVGFCEVSAAEHISEVADAFQQLIREALLVRQKVKQSLFDRVLRNRGSLRIYARGKSDSALP